MKAMFLAMMMLLLVSCQEKHETSYLVDWEQPDNDENPILVMVEP